MARFLTLKTLFLGIALSIAGTLPLQAEETDAPQDEIIMSNGSRIVGTITGARDGVITLETDFAGTLSIDRDQVASLKSSQDLVIMLADDSVMKGQGVETEAEQLLITDTAGAQHSVALEDLAILNPEPWEMGEGYKWTGLVNFAFAIERGNSDTDELDYKLESVWRSDDDRFTVKLNGEIDEANDQKNADNWNIIGKYDYFLEDEVTYWGLNAFAEQDEFADLDLRYFIGPYIGREFYTDPVFMLSAEVGASYVNEDFITAPDQEYPGANWMLHMSSDYLGGDSRLYFDQLGVWNLDETSDYIVNTTIGLAFPLLWGFEAAAEVLLEYDAGAVDGVEKLDETYALRLGYTW